MAYHGGSRPGEELFLDFSYSANPYYPRFLNKYLKNARHERYPYCEDSLEVRIKERYGVYGDVIITAGITEGLYAAAYALRGRRAVMLAHTYSEYERVWRLFNPDAQVVKVKALDPSLEDILGEIRKGDVVFFGNPNNPTGRYYEYMPRLLEEVERSDGYLILDEAFIAFTGRPYFNPKSDRAIVLRSFTKEYGIPGIRIGYAVAAGDVARRIREYRAPWAIGSIGCAALEGILHDSVFLNQTLRRIMKEKARIERVLNVRSDANFFIMNVGNAKQATMALRREGILVRDCTSFGLPEMIRFSVRKRQENTRLIKSILSINR